MRTRLLSAFALLLVSACLNTSVAGLDEESGGALADVGRCKEGCDKMKFFRCNSAEEQARCYSDCDTASASQIEVFVGCAENSICDPSCRTTIQPKPEATASGTAAPAGSGASSSSCSKACGKAVSCNLIPVGAKDACASECQAKGYQYQIDCVNSTPCDEIKTKCGGMGGDLKLPDLDFGPPQQDPLRECEEACDGINRFRCGNAEAHSACREQCAAKTGSSRNTFIACEESSGAECSRKMGCLEKFLR